MDFPYGYVKMLVKSVRRSMTIIRKYGNRRLYDTSAKRYVNLDEIAQMIRGGGDVQVVDAKTGEDLTRTILTQIIVEDSKNQNGGLPLEILRELVAFSDRAKHDGLMWYLRSAFDTYRRAQHAPVEFMRNLFAPRADEDLRRRVEELERQLAARNKD
jgi:polyhydroxyalkanoate synthesis repressor PhaR